MPTFLRVVDTDQPVCRHLRTKALYVHGHDTPDVFFTSRSSHYHCLRTQFVTGPDGGLTVPESCQPERGCFERR